MSLLDKEQISLTLETKTLVSAIIANMVELIKEDVEN